MHRYKYALLLPQCTTHIPNMWAMPCGMWCMKHVLIYSPSNKLESRLSTRPRMRRMLWGMVSPSLTFSITIFIFSLMQHCYDGIHAHSAAWCLLFLSLEQKEPSNATTTLQPNQLLFPRGQVGELSTTLSATFWAFFVNLSFHCMISYFSLSFLPSMIIILGRLKIFN